MGPFSIFAGFVWPDLGDLCQERKKQPKEKVFGRNVPQTSMRISRQTSGGQEFSPDRSESRTTKSFVRTSLTQRGRCAWPEGVSDKTLGKILQADSSFAIVGMELWKWCSAKMHLNPAMLPTPCWFQHKTQETSPLKRKIKTVDPCERRTSRE